MDKEAMDAILAAQKALNEQIAKMIPDNEEKDEGFWSNPEAAIDKLNKKIEAIAGNAEFAARHVVSKMDEGVEEHPFYEYVKDKIEEHAKDPRTANVPGWKKKMVAYELGQPGMMEKIAGDVIKKAGELGAERATVDVVLGRGDGTQIVKDERVKKREMTSIEQKLATDLGMDEKEFAEAGNKSYRGEEGWGE